MENSLNTVFSIHIIWSAICANNIRRDSLVTNRKQLNWLSAKYKQCTLVGKERQKEEKKDQVRKSVGKKERKKEKEGPTMHTMFSNSFGYSSSLKLYITYSS
jgi:hypothetical protein